MNKIVLFIIIVTLIAISSCTQQHKVEYYVDGDEMCEYHSDTVNTFMSNDIDVKVESLSSTQYIIDCFNLNGYSIGNGHHTKVYQRPIHLHSVSTIPTR